MDILYKNLSTLLDICYKIFYFPFQWRVGYFLFQNERDDKCIWLHFHNLNFLLLIKNIKNFFEGLARSYIILKSNGCHCLLFITLQRWLFDRNFLGLTQTTSIHSVFIITELLWKPRISLVIQYTNSSLTI